MNQSVERFQNNSYNNILKPDNYDNDSKMNILTEGSIDHELDNSNQIYELNK